MDNKYLYDTEVAPALENKARLKKNFSSNKPITDMNHELIKDADNIEALAQAVYNVKGVFKGHGFGPVPLRDMLAKTLDEFLWNHNVTEQSGEFYDMVYAKPEETVLDEEFKNSNDMSDKSSNKDDNGQLMNKIKQDELRKRAAPLMKWLRDNMHPHTKVIITGSSAELLTGIAAVMDDL